MFVDLFADTKMCILSETEQFMSSTSTYESEIEKY